MKQLYLTAYYPSTVNKISSVLLMTILSGNVIAEPVYGGKDHQSYIHKSVDNSHKTGSNVFAEASIVDTFNQVQVNNYSSTISQNTTIDGDLFGGSAVYHATSGEAKAGNATADQSTGSVASAFANAQTTIEDSFVYANHNTAQVTDNGSVVGDVYGGSAILRAYSAKAKAGNASATGDDSEATAYANSYTLITTSAVQANENIVNVADNASITGSIFAGKATLYTQSQEALAGDVDGEFTNSSANSHATVEDSSVHVDRNAITITDNASVKGNVYGGYAEILVNSSVAKAGNSNFVNSSDASANVQASSINNIISASNNIVTITENANVQGNMFGGYAKLIAVAGQATSGTENGNSGNVSAYVHAKDTKLYASNNQITVDGSLANGSIYGGYLIFELNPSKATRPDGKAGDTDIDQSGSVAQAINNSITIADNGRILDSATSLYGGYLEANEKRLPESYDVFSGNTLNFSAKPITIRHLANFEHYNFAIRPELANTQTSLITAKDVVFGTHSVNSNGVNNTSKIQVVGIHSGQILNAGDSFYLIRAENSMGGFGGKGSISQAQQGISLLYDVETKVDMDQGTVIAKIIERKNIGPGTGIKVNPQLEALPAGQQAGLLLLSRAADMIADDVMSSIQNKDNGFNFSMHNSNNYSRYNSGYLKSDDKLFTAVISYKQDKLTSGFFIETGSSNFDSSTSPALSKVNSDGNNRYYGIGTLGRYQLNNGLYTDGSIRIGKSENTFSSKDIVNLASGESASYSLKSNYVSTHIGVGKVFTLKQGNQLDISTKYLWSHLEGKSVIVAGDPISFNSTDSKRLRTNANLSHQYNKNLKLNLGLGYEHEFDAKAEGSTYGTFDIKARSVQGETGIISVGATYQSEANNNFSVDIKTQSYVGKRNGASLGISLNYKF